MKEKYFKIKNKLQFFVIYQIIYRMKYRTQKNINKIAANNSLNITKNYSSIKYLIKAILRNQFYLNVYLLFRNKQKTNKILYFLPL